MPIIIGENRNQMSMFCLAGSRVNSVGLDWSLFLSARIISDRKILNTRLLTAWAE